MMRVLFVGPVSGYASYSVVCKGILRALITCGVHPCVADTTWDGSEDHTDPFFSGENITWLERREILGLVQTGNIGEGYGSICIAINPGHHLMQLKEQGVRVIGMHVGDVDEIPEAWLECMEQEELILTPSSWCKDVIERAGVTVPVTVLNHGVSPVFKPNPEQLAWDREEPFTLLHPCASTFYPDRKGTPQVIEAVSQLVSEGENIILRLIFGMKTKPIKELLRGVPVDVRSRVQLHYHEGSRSQKVMAAAYHACHALLVPSRAEGFGMQPLEARACGTPVIQTLCTGMADHLAPGETPEEMGIVQVPHGDLEPAWGKFGMAPEVCAEAVYESIKTAMTDWPRLKQAALMNAEAVGITWAWERTTMPLVFWLKENA
jgi:glycosyltransferase involved in cell wall biosynthesis